MSVAEVELILFLLDGSESMKWKETEDKRPKREYLNEIVMNVLKRFRNSGKASCYKISLVSFAWDAFVIKTPDKISYYSIDYAIDAYQDPVDVTGSGTTSISHAISAARQILDEFAADEGMPDDKNATILLFTDGMETDKLGDPTTGDEVRKEAMSLISHPVSPSLATISFGLDADEELLTMIATKPNQRQKDHLRNARVYRHLPNKDKLFLVGHDSGIVTKEKVETIRNFIEILSMTV
ncbi:MAG: vWA domain-containing protein [Candidatus Odinarchaeota archaeon]